MSRRAKRVGVPVLLVTLVSRRRALATLVVSLKVIVPSLMLRFPFAGAWGNYVLDSVDGDVLLELGVTEEAYQTIDKAADYFSYVIMLIVGLRWRIKRLIVLLFAYRTVGQALFFATRKEIVFLVFPNFLEPLVLIYTFLLFRNRGLEPRAYAAYRRHRDLIWIAIIAYKLWNEWSLHVANIDLSEQVFGFTGGAREPGHARPPSWRIFQESRNESRRMQKKMVCNNFDPQHERITTSARLAALALKGSLGSPRRLDRPAPAVRLGISHQEFRGDQSRQGPQSPVAEPVDASALWRSTLVCRSREGPRG
jgi:hypothetical protein